MTEFEKMELKQKARRYIALDFLQEWYNNTERFEDTCIAPEVMGWLDVKEYIYDDGDDYSIFDVIRGVIKNPTIETNAMTYRERYYILDLLDFIYNDLDDIEDLE